MKKHKLLFLGVALAAMPFVASADEQFNSSGFGNNKYDGRYLTSFTLNNKSGNSLGSQKFEVNQTSVGGANTAVFQDKTATTFNTTAGATVEFSELTWEGSWMHGFLYINCGKDEGFNSNLNEANYPANPPTGFNVPSDPKGDLIVFSAHKFGNAWYDSRGGSAGTGEKAGGLGVTTTTMGEFKIPDLEPGEYQALFKIDWDSFDQNGNPERTPKDNSMAANGGCAVLFTIKVVALSTSTREITIRSNDINKGTVKFQGEENGVAQATKEFKDGATAIVVAEAAPDYFFLNWTKDGEVVSTNAEYTVDIYDEVFTLTANFVSEEEIPDDTFDWNRYNQVYSSTASGSKRALTSFTLSNRADDSSQKFEINQVYSAGVSIRFDKRAVVFNTTPGSTVDFSEFDYNGAWRDACLFINYNGDEGFNSRLNNTGLNLSEDASSYFDVLNPSPRGELVAFSSHEFADGVFFNSQGSKTDKNGKELNSSYFGDSPCLSAANMPSFTIPDWVKTGDYMALLKIAWGDLDQHPVATKAEDLISMGGCAVLFTIHVENTEHRVEWQTEGPAIETTASYTDAAHVTLHYNTEKIDPKEHFIQVYAVPTADESAESAPAYRTMARAAADTEDDDKHENCIYPDNFENVGEDSEGSEDSENRTLVFTIPLNNEKNKSNPTLHFAPTNKGYGEGTTHTYNVTVKTFDKEGNELNESVLQPITFTTTTTNQGGTSGVVDIEEAATAAPRYYNLQGIEVAQPTSAGVYIVRQGNAVSKVYVK